MIDFETSKKQIASLVEEFKTNEHIYKTVAFDEENTKINFINKFFQALGWDVTNEAGVAPQFKDVEFEDTVLVGGKPKAPDYCFRIGGARIFFVEAKKPSVDIEHDRRYAFQLKRYTWSAHLPLGLLTDFEELAIYEPKTAPKKTHNTSVDRIKYYHYSEYVDNWEEIYNIYSKEAVLTGKFDQYVKNIHGDKKGTSTVDSEFLKTIEEWRLELAKNIALRNKELTVDELNFAVQLIIDRIIFLRIAEDRGIERYGQLKKLTELARNEKDNYPVYDAFIELCRKADAKYNSGLFHFTEEKDISLSADTLTPGLKVDDGKLKKIIDGLYYPDCPYEFSMISTEILGNIYEQFLGKVIRLTDGHQAKVEEKPEVKKAGGVYYTPQYIVDYIVENTVGEFLKGKTPNQVSELRIVDPACGSGSFLLGAYQKLINWHVEYYSNLEQPPKNVIYTGKEGIVRLTIQEKKRILLNNIYGVDIDSQAVEVTKLSLLLKVLEDENKDVLEAQQKLIQERALPYLGDNIRCGNSLVGNEILLIDEFAEDFQKINPFDWKDEFKQIFEEGGFDVVIGNPPYVGEKGNKETFHPIKKTEWGKQFYKRKMDLFYFFFHKSLDLLKENGIFGMITTNYFITADSGIKLRNDLKERANLLKLINLNELTVFENAKGQHDLITTFKKKSTNSKKPTVDTIFVNRNESSNKKLFNEITSGKDKLSVYSKVKQDDIYDTDKNYIRIPKYDNTIMKNIFNKILEGSNLLGDIKKVSQGIITGADKVTQRHLNNLNLKDIEKNEGVYVVSNDELNSLNLNNDEMQIIKPFFKNSDVYKYYTNEEAEKFLVYVTRDLNINKYPNIKKHLYKYSKIIKARSQDRGEIKAALKLGKWWVVFASRSDTNFEDEKIVVPQRSPSNTFGYNSVKWYSSADVYFITNISDSDNISLKYILSLLNSKLYYFWLVNKGKTKGDLLELYYTPLTEIPIKIIPEEEQEPFINLADNIIELNKELKSCTVPNKCRLLENHITILDNEINKLVYELYGLSDEEIEIIEDITRDIS